MTHERVRSNELFQLSLEVLPNVSTLSIQGGGGDRRKKFSIPKFQQIMTAASDKLHSLTIAIPRFRANRCYTGAVSTPPAPVITAQPKCLGIREFGAEDQVAESCAWFWHACDKMKEIELYYLSDAVVEHLVDSIRNWMPPLDTINFGP